MSKKAKPSAGTPATVALDAAGLAYSLHPYQHDPASELSFGLEAAAALGVPAEQVFKTLVAVVDGTLVVGVVPVTGQLDLKALAAAAGGKRAAMADTAVAERATGYVVGGISPIGQRQRLRVVVDESASAHETVFVSGGRRGLDIGMSPATLLAASGATTAPIARA